MACEPRFEAKLDWDCVKELISDVRNNNVGLCCVTKGLWIAGCAVAIIDSDTNSGPFGYTVTLDTSVEDICNSLELMIPKEDVAMDSGKLDVNTLVLLVQLVWKLIQSLKN